MSTPTAPNTETSVTFSLQELLLLEQQRVQEQAQMRQRQEQQERDRRERLREQQEQAEQQRLREMQEQRAQKERAAREEAARLEALQRAVVENARHETLERAHAAQRQAEQEHELRLAAFRSDTSRKRLRALLAATNIASASIIVCLVGLYFASIRPDNQSRLALAQESLRQRSEQLKQAEQRSEGQAATIDQLKTDARLAEIDRKRLVSQLADATARLQDKPKSTGKPAGTVAIPTTDTCTNPDDPACGLGNKRGW